ncbi:TolC family protein [Larkinella humicola]|uniref:TolC family protein n=1 Tax=Larkinella humicola TaxID=2607654 RepID=A0A5N1JL60_9BACT|nr:TolC family protein [Larkinella humicola]KAA9353794.1 TolC family protein [Larkinella humicola]
MIKYVTLVVLLWSGMARAQDTLSIHLRQADSLFVGRNLLALAGRYQIETAQAEVIQAGLFDNPTITAEINAYNPERRRVLDVGKQGQKFVAIEQLLYTAGKRNKRIALAQESAHLTELGFRDLLRVLRFELHSRFYEIYFQQNTLKQYEQQVLVLQTTLNAFEEQYQRNNVSLLEMLRLKSLLFQLSKNRTEIQSQLVDQQQFLQTLLSTNQPIRPLVDEAALVRLQPPVQPLDSLQNLALQNRPDVRISESLTRQAQLNYTLQRALAKPDVRVGGVYDQSSNYIQNYTGLSVSMDLPLFNRNQGAIRAAKSQIGYQQKLHQQKTIQVENEVTAVWQKIRNADQMIRSVEGRFTEQFEELNRGVLANFLKRNISLLEFVDLFETYTENIRDLNRLKTDRMAAYEEFNYVMGTNLSN